MTPTLQYKHVVIRTTKCLLKGEEINDITFYDKGDNRGHLFELDKWQKITDILLYMVIEIYTINYQQFELNFSNFFDKSFNKP